MEDWDEGAYGFDAPADVAYGLLVVGAYGLLIEAAYGILEEDEYRLLVEDAYGLLSVGA
jgi:hypothetical protein